MNSHVYCRTSAASFAAAIAIGVALTGVPAASADPQDIAPGTPPVPAPAEPQSAAAADPQAPAADGVSDDGGGVASDACKRFSVALNYAASNYEDFAYDSAGEGNIVNYADPNVANSNVVGRTALREAVGTAMSVSMTPGLQPDIASPMQSWSMRATKLVLLMGLRGGGDSLNSTATDLNNDARNVQMACALAGTPA